MDLKQLNGLTVLLVEHLAMRVVPDRRKSWIATTAAVDDQLLEAGTIAALKEMPM